MIKKTFLFVAVVCGAAVLMGGCATKKYVNDGLSAQDAKLGDLSTQVESNQRRIAEAGDKIQSVDSKATEAERIGKDAGSKADQANTKAGEAYDLAKGKLMYKVVLDDVAGTFALNKSDLSSDAQAKLDQMAENLKRDNANVFLEIEGYTDSSGDANYNLMLGQKRAEAVRRYLNIKHGIPLHKMSVISFGEENPVADNGTRDGRAQNRRVEIKVLS